MTGAILSAFYASCLSQLPFTDKKFKDKKIPNWPIRKRRLREVKWNAWGYSQGDGAGRGGEGKAEIHTRQFDPQACRGPTHYVTLSPNLQRICSISYHQQSLGFAGREKNAWNLTGLLWYLFWQPKLIVHSLSCFWQFFLMTRTAFSFLFSLARLPGMELTGAGEPELQRHTACRPGCAGFHEKGSDCSHPLQLLRVKTGTVWFSDEGKSLTELIKPKMINE